MYICTSIIEKPEKSSVTPLARTSTYIYARLIYAYNTVCIQLQLYKIVHVVTIDNV